MACELNGPAVEFLYGYIYGEISDRISGKNKTAIDIKGIMKKLYTELNKMPNEGFESEEDKKEKALYFAQAVPQIFGLVAARPKARDYILKTNTQLFIDIPTLANEYSDIKKVEILVKPTIKTKKVAKKEVEKELDSPSAPEVDDTKPYDHSGWSAAEYSAKVVYPNGTTGQEAIKVDPNSNKPKNVRDPEKKMFGEVIRDIIYIARQTSESNTEVLYGEDEPVSLALKAMRVSDADPTMFTQSDLEFQKKNPGTTGMIAVVTDTEGNEVYFNEDGSIKVYKTYSHLVFGGKYVAKKFLDWLYKDSTEETRLSRKYRKYLELAEYVGEDPKPHNNQKIDQEVANTIRTLHQTLSPKDISLKLDVPLSTIYDVLSNRSWFDENYVFQKSNQDPH
jgi:sugar-specific transcriptional regulator TrmB